MSVTALCVLVLSISKVWGRRATGCCTAVAERSVWRFIVASRQTRKQDWSMITVRHNAYGIRRWKKRQLDGSEWDRVDRSSVCVVKEKGGLLVKPGGIKVDEEPSERFVYWFTGRDGTGTSGVIWPKTLYQKHIIKGYECCSADESVQRIKTRGQTCSNQFSRPFYSSLVKPIMR